MNVKRSDALHDFVTSQLRCNARVNVAEAARFPNSHCGSRRVGHVVAAPASRVARRLRKSLRKIVASIDRANFEPRPRTSVINLSEFALRSLRATNAKVMDEIHEVASKDIFSTGLI